MNLKSLPTYKHEAENISVIIEKRLYASEDFSSRRYESLLPMEVEDLHDSHKVSITYINKSNINLYVKDRLGVVTTVYPAKSLTGDKTFVASPELRLINNEKLVIAYSTSFFTTEYESLLSQYANLQHINSLYAKIYVALRDFAKYKQDSLERTGSVYRYELTAMISIYGYDWDGKEPIYVESIGVTAATPGNRFKLQNPSNLPDILKQRNNLYNPITGTAYDPAQVTVTAYRKSDKVFVNKLYIDLLNQIQEIPIEYDPTASTDGIVIVVKRPIQDNQDPIKKGSTLTKEPTRIEIPFDDPDFETIIASYGIATSVSAASKGRDRALIERKEQVEDREHRIKELTQETALVKLRYEQMMLEQKRQSDEVLARLKREQQMRDEELSDLRQVNDNIKTYLGTFTTVLTFILTLVKLTSS